MENNNRLTDKEFWDKDYRDLGCVPMERNYPITEELYNFFANKAKGKTVFEVGCFPGRFLYHFGKMGFELHGIDQTEYLPKMTNWLLENNFSIGGFSQGDFFSLDSSIRYDVVFSSGFIEHFTNFEEVLLQHMKLVKDGGYVCITVPNFRGSIQKFLHTYLDKENLEKHYLPSMDIGKWEGIAKANGFEIKKAEYIGGFDFWIADPSIFKQIIAKLIRVFLGWRFLPDSSKYSPEIFFIAQKIGTK